MTNEQITEALRLASEVAEKASLLPAGMDAETDICCCPQCEAGPPYPCHESYVYGLSCGKVRLCDETLDDMPTLEALVQFIIHARTAAPALADAVQSLVADLAAARQYIARLEAEALACHELSHGERMSDADFLACAGAWLAPSDATGPVGDLRVVERLVKFLGGTVTWKSY